MGKKRFCLIFVKKKKNLKEGWQFEDGIEKKMTIILITTKHSERIAKQLGQTSGLYHKTMTIVNDNSGVITKLETYNRHRFIVQATAASFCFQVTAWVPDRKLAAIFKTLYYFRKLQIGP